MAGITETRKTVADWMALGEGPPFAELINGEIVMAPSPARSHQQVVQRLFFLIQSYLEVSPAGRIYIAPFDVHFGEHQVLCPDLAFFSAENLHLLSDRGAEGAPDLVIEVISPATARRDRKVKREIYARHGVKELWLVQPDAETIEVFDFSRHPDEPVAVLENGTHPAIATPLLRGLELPLEKIFQR